MAVVNRDKALNSMLRTTCVATMIQGGHAVNALPQKVEANVNCRIFPGHSREEIKGEIARIVGNDKIAIRYGRDDKPVAKPPALDPRLIGPMEKLAAKHFPRVPVIPAMSTGATDAVYTSGAGIPTYGVPSAWTDPDGNGTHGLNERLEIKGVYTARDYLHDLVKALANTK
jgi:acetylornithine deacetylase/succinyl-diaminopimelate desuccinylase-like protein